MSYSIRRLRWRYRMLRDRPLLLGKAGGYVEHCSAAIGSSTRKQPGNLNHEPEATPLSEESIRARQDAFDVLKGEEKARREARSRAERLAAAELELRAKGVPHEQHAADVERTIEDMRRQAKAA